MKTLVVILLGVLVANCGFEPGTVDIGESQYDQIDEPSGGRPKEEDDESTDETTDDETTETTTFFEQQYTTCVDAIDVANRWMEMCENKFHPFTPAPLRTTCVDEYWYVGVTNRKCQSIVEGYQRRIDSDDPCTMGGISESMQIEWCPPVGIPLPNDKSTDDIDPWTKQQDTAPDGAYVTCDDMLRYIFVISKKCDDANWFDADGCLDVLWRNKINDDMCLSHMQTVANMMNVTDDTEYTCSVLFESYTEFGTIDEHGRLINWCPLAKPEN